MTSEIYKGIKIDFKPGSACIMPCAAHPKFKGFASDEVVGGLSGLEKAKKHIDSL